MTEAFADGNPRDERSGTERWIDGTIERANARRAYYNSLQYEHYMCLLPETVPASSIALIIAHELHARGLQQIPQDILQRLVLVVLEENDYRIVRRNPPELPPEPTQQPVVMHGHGSVVEMQHIFDRGRATEELTKKQGDQPGWVYYLRVGDRIKIGYSTAPARRLKAYPPDSELLAIHPGTPDLERQLHKQFDHNLVSGREWFTEALDLREHIATALEEYGPPPKEFKPKYRKRAKSQVRPSYWSGK